MRFGITGSAHGHILSFINDMLSSGHEFTGVVNDGLELCKTISGKYNVPLVDSSKDLLTSGIDIAGSSAVNDQKAEIIKECSLYGVHVMLDKPLVTDEASLDMVKDVISQGRIQIGLMLTVRFMPAVAALKRLVDEGRLGELISLEIFNPHKLMPDKRPAWHFDKAQSGGIIVDLMIHSIDTFNWLTNSDITDFYGTITKSSLPDKPGFYDSSQFFAIGSKNTTGYFRVDWNMPDKHWNWGDMRIFASGTKACAEVRATGDPLTRQPMLILYSKDMDTSVIDTGRITGSETTDFLNRIDSRPYVIGHDDIISATTTTLLFDKYAKKLHI